MGALEDPQVAWIIWLVIGFVSCCCYVWICNGIENICRGIKNRREEREAKAREQEKGRKKAEQTQGYLAVPVLPIMAVDIECAHAGAGFTHAV